MPRPRDLPTHESMLRLLEFATRATSDERYPVVDWRSLHSRFTSTSAGKFSNWKKRGLSKAGALQAEKLFGCSPQWLLYGKGPDAPMYGAQARTDATAITPAQWEILQDLEAIPPKERTRILNEIREAAASFREHAVFVMEQMERNKIKK